jgi:hypothetical protein
MTCWAWLAQFITNMFLVVLVKIVYGKDQFVFLAIGLVALFFNFNVLPFIYIILSNDKIKKALFGKEYFQMVRLLFEL